MNQSISVPVAYEATLFVFDFRRELERAEMFRDSTRSSLRSVVQLLSRVINETSVENVKKVLQEAGVAEANNDDWVLQLVDRMQTGIYRSVTQGSLTPLMLKDVLQRADFTSLLETFNQNMGYAEIEQILHAIQQFYGMFVQSDSTESVASYIHGQLASNPVYNFADGLYTIMDKIPGASSEAKLDYVMNKISSVTTGRPYLDYLPVIEGMVYEIHSSALMTDVTYYQLLHAFFRMLRSLMGVYTNPETVNVNIQDFVNMAVTGIGELLPFLPAEVPNEVPSRAEQLVVTLFHFHLTYRILLGQYGNLSARIEQVKDIRKYSRNDAYEQVIRDGITISSVIFESFLDTAALLKNMLQSDRILYVEMHPLQQKQVAEFVWNYLGKYKNFGSLERSRFLNQPAHIINQSVPEGFVNFDFFIRDEVYDSEQKIIVNPHDWSVTEYAKQKLVKGSSLDTPLPAGANTRLLSFAKDVQVDYVYRGNLPSLLDHDLVIYSTRLVPLSKIRYVGMFRYLSQFGKIRYIHTPEQLSVVLGIPLEVAKAQFSGDLMYFDFTEHKTIHYIWNHNEFPVYEEGILDSAELSIYVTPFVAHYPAVLIDEIEVGDPRALRTPSRLEPPLPSTDGKVGNAIVHNDMIQSQVNNSMSETKKEEDSTGSSPTNTKTI